MLTDDFPRPDLLHSLISSAMHPERPFQRRLDRGIYERASFGGTGYVPGWDEWPEFDGDRSCYGVCDEYNQVLRYLPELAASNERTFVLFLTYVWKHEQEAVGGWRWHKWGPYIGDKEPKHEYLYDEDDDIQFVMCWHVYEGKDDG